MPKNIADRDDVKAVLRSLLGSLDSATYHILDGQLVTSRIGPDEIETTVDLIASCSIIYVLEGSRCVVEPIAGFIANRSQRTAKLVHLIDRRIPVSPGIIDPQTIGGLGLYMRWMFSKFDWVDRITVPADIQSIDGQMDLQVVEDIAASESRVSCVTLRDRLHRPKSSRPLGG